MSLSRAALDERGWTPLVDDPRAAAQRAARSIGFVAADCETVLVYAFRDDADLNGSGRLRRILEEEFETELARYDDASLAIVSRSRGSTDDSHGAAAAAAERVDADVLMLLIAEPVLWAGVGDERRAIRVASASQLAALDLDGGGGDGLHGAEGQDAAVAAIEFVRRTSRCAVVGALDHADAMIHHEGGTVVLPRGDVLECYGARPQAVLT